MSYTILSKFWIDSESNLLFAHMTKYEITLQYLNKDFFVDKDPVILYDYELLDYVAPALIKLNESTIMICFSNYQLMCKLYDANGHFLSDNFILNSSSINKKDQINIEIHNILGGK